MSWVAELKRRNVFRVGVLYLLAGWLTLQVTQLLFGLLELPGWSTKFVLGLLVVGFPPLLLFAWAYELTPEGLKKQHEVDRSQSITHETGRKINYLIGALAVLAIVAIAFERFIPHSESVPASTVESPGSGSVEAPAPAGTKSIAVLPFVNMSSDEANEYFADGLSEELLNVLAKNPELRVAARTSAFKFKGEKVDVQDVARKLNVAHVLEGSVRKSGDRVRITAQLIKGADGYHVWSQTYDRTLDDIFAVQDEIAGEVGKSLQLTLLGNAAARTKPVNPEAYNLTLQGRYSRLQNTPQGVARAIQYYRQALELDPAYAAAWAGLSRAYARQADVGLLPTAEGYRLAREAAQKALALDPESVDVLLSMAWIHATYDWDWEAADASARKALELEPGNADALRVAALLASGLGRWDDALDLSNKSIERDPLRAGTYNNLGNVLLALDRDADAEAALRKALELTPGGSSIHVQIGLALVLQGKAEAGLQEIRAEPDDTVRATGLPLALHALGRSSEADAALAALKEKYADVAAFQIAEAHAYRGEANAAFEWLDRAYSQRDGGLAGIKYSRFLRGLDGDPRYGALLRKLKLPV